MLLEALNVYEIEAFQFMLEHTDKERDWVCIGKCGLWFKVISLHMKPYVQQLLMALQAARDVYTRRGEGVSIWVVPSASITASDPEQRDENFEPSTSKIYRHPSFYDIPDDVGHM